MTRLLVIASLLAGCRLSLEKEADSTCEPDPASSTCSAVAGQATLQSLQTNIFTLNCALATSCHGAGGNPPELTAGQSYARLVNAASVLQPSRKFIVPGDVSASYLMVMVHGIEPAEASPPTVRPPGGYMPKGLPPLCCEKLDALQRWIEAGAPNN